MVCCLVSVRRQIEHERHEQGHEEPCDQSGGRHGWYSSLVLVVSRSVRILSVAAEEVVVSLLPRSAWLWIVVQGRHKLANKLS